jgi:hypothetical protein
MANQHITSLDEYLEAVYGVIQKCIEKGGIGFKDQSAYDRQISYDLVPKCEAEKLFNQVLSDPRSSLGWPEHKPLSDFLFHQFMRFARDLDLPVQIHTGHMAGNYNQVAKTNAAYLTSVLELHKGVRFDLFHGNWPYLGDLLFLGKNYPNVALDLCWLHIIDPDYSVELERASNLAAHKIHGLAAITDGPSTLPLTWRLRAKTSLLPWRGWWRVAGWTRKMRSGWLPTGCSITTTASSSWVLTKFKPGV